MNLSKGRAFYLIIGLAPTKVTGINVGVLAAAENVKVLSFENYTASGTVQTNSS
jgi:hypothetical protein